ncbi:MAG TPA: GNAT family N-acetyltransferase [Verrucomicrobiae bacterium]|nr:GNAT family N-acetyltransferase [Verrucomicrobiae bacterium]
MQVVVAGTAGEFRVFRDLATEYEASLPPHLRHAEFETERARVSEVYAPPDAALLAYLGDGACGCVALKRHDSKTAVVKKLYVKPEARGRGAARALMESLIALAGERGFGRLVLDTERDALAAAYQLYVSLGFAECAPVYDVTYPSPTFMELQRNEEMRVPSAPEV